MTQINSFEEAKNLVAQKRYKKDFGKLGVEKVPLWPEICDLWAKACAEKAWNDACDKADDSAVYIVTTSERGKIMTIPRNHIKQVKSLNPYKP